MYGRIWSKTLRLKSKLKVFAKMDGQTRNSLLDKHDWLHRSIIICSYGWKTTATTTTTKLLTKPNQTKPEQITHTTRITMEIKTRNRIRTRTVAATVTTPTNPRPTDQPTNQKCPFDLCPHSKNAQKIVRLTVPLRPKGLRYGWVTG